MKARLVVFPIRGRNWCFSRSIDHSALESRFGQTPSTIKDLWKIVSSSSSIERPSDSNSELVVDFAANKMNRAWTALEKAPPRSFKNKIHGLGLRLLAGVKPSEIFLKSISKDITKLEVTYPPSLNTRLVRRRLRHIALREQQLASVLYLLTYNSSSGSKDVWREGERERANTLSSTLSTHNWRGTKCSFQKTLSISIHGHFAPLMGTAIHKRYFYGSVLLLPLTTAFTVLPLPNIPFFWILFRTYSHRRALKGSERLLQLVSDCTENQKSSANGSKTSHNNSEKGKHNSLGSPWVLQPSEELEKLLNYTDADNGLSNRTISDICKTLDLNTMDVLKYQHSM